MESKKLAQTLIKLSQSENADTAISEFFSFLKKKNLLGLLPQIKKHVVRHTERESASDKLVILTKHELSEKEIKQIITLVKADKNIETEVIIDTTIVGGFSAMYNGHIYDGSLRNQITQMRTQLTHS